MATELVTPEEPADCCHGGPAWCGRGVPLVKTTDMAQGSSDGSVGFQAGQGSAGDQRKGHHTHAPAASAQEPGHTCPPGLRPQNPDPQIHIWRAQIFSLPLLLRPLLVDQRTFPGKSRLSTRARARAPRGPKRAGWSR